MQDQTGRCEAIIRGSHFIYYEYLFYFHSTIIKLHCIMGTCISSQIAHKINQNLICKYYYRHAGRYCTRTWHRCSWVSSNIVTNFDMNQVTCKCWGSFSANSYWQPFPKRNRCPKLLKDKSILCSTLLFRWSCVQTVKENSHPPAEQDGIAESMFPSQC